MASPRRVSPTLTACFAVLVGGLIGLTWWGLRTRRQPPGAQRRGQPRSRGRRIRFGALVVLLVLIAVGTVWRSKVAFDSVAACPLPPGAQPSSSVRPAGPALFAEKVTTWPETGLGMLYGDVVGASQCFYRPAGYYLDFHSGKYAGARIVNVGDLTLLPPHDTRVHIGDVVADHEARHRSQWAVVTAMAGPLAFPILYGIDDFFFPGSRNHFERLAGLESGGYQNPGIAPVIGWPQLAVLLAAAALIAMLIWRRLHRKSQGAHDAMQSSGDSPAATRAAGD